MKSALTALAISLVVLFPAMQASAQEQESVPREVTFRLTIQGDPPQDDSFLVSYTRDLTDIGNAILFCGPLNPITNPGAYNSSIEQCEGGKTYTYNGETRLGRSDDVGFQFYRAYTDASGEVEVEGIANHFQGASKDGETYSVTYVYPSQDNDRKDGTEQPGHSTDTGQLPTQLPNTGAGDMTRGWSRGRAVLLHALSVKPALVQGSQNPLPEVEVAVDLDCYSDPEVVSVRNRGAVAVTVESVGSLYQPGGDETFERADQVWPGFRFSYLTSPEPQPIPPEIMTQLARRLVFHDSMETEGVRVVLRVETGERIDAVVQVQRGKPDVLQRGATLCR